VVLIAEFYSTLQTLSRQL